MGTLRGKRAAVIGLGRMGLRHITAYQRAEATVIAATDIKEEARKLAESQSPSLKTYANWKELLMNEKMDILSVATNGPSHAEIVVAAAEYKVPIIFCEKPMATNLADANQMIAMCEKQNSKLFINLTLRVFPSFEKLITLLNSGAIGIVRHISVSMAGKRGLGCVGTHYIDLMRLITGSEVARAWGRIDKTGTPNPRGAQFRDPGGYGIYEFKNGARGVIEMSEDLSHEPLMIIIGSRGKVIIDLAESRWDDKAPTRWEVHKTSDDDSGIVKIPFDAGEPMDIIEGTAKSFEAIVTGQGGVATGVEGKKALEMVMGLHISDARGNQLVEFPLKGKDLEFDVPMT